MKKYLLLLFLLLPLGSLLAAAHDFYQFNTPQQAQRFQLLTTELRCLVCQNQTLAESNAPLAGDLRKQIYQQIMRHQSDQQIVDYLVARYGDFILYRPPVNAATLGLWFGPIAFLLSGLAYLFFYLQKNNKRGAA